MPEYSTVDNMLLAFKQKEYEPIDISLQIGLKNMVRDDSGTDIEVYKAFPILMPVTSALLVEDKTNDTVDVTGLVPMPNNQPVA
jgi:hypothetical protein